MSAFPPRKKQHKASNLSKQLTNEAAKNVKPSVNNSEFNEDGELKYNVLEVLGERAAPDAYAFSPTG